MDRASAYAILELAAGATPDDVRVAYRRRAFATHPDRAGGDPAAFLAVCDAYQSLLAPAGDRAEEPGAAPEPGGSPRVPPTDAAKVLFQYLGDLAFEMILNGATPETVVSFLQREGCPESVARALERDLRDGVLRSPGSLATAPAFDAPPAMPSVARRPVRSFPRWLAMTGAAAVVGACIVGVSLLGQRASSSAGGHEVVQPGPVAVAPSQPIVPAPPPRSEPAHPTVPTRSTRSAPVRASAPTRASAQQAPRPPVRARETASIRSTSADLDAERDALEADQRRFAAEVTALEAERSRIDAAEAALASASDVERYAAVTTRKAAYNARLQAVRRTEAALQVRVRELNARIATYNDRVRSGR